MSEKFEHYNLGQAQEEKGKEPREKVEIGEVANHSEAEKQVKWEHAATSIKNLRSELERQYELGEKIRNEFREKVAQGEISESEVLERMREEMHREGLVSERTSTDEMLRLYKGELKVARKLDAGVDETLIALKASGLHTSECCRGHPEEIDRPVTEESEYLPQMPEVSFDVPPSAHESAEKINQRQFEKLTDLSREFYKDRPNTPSDIQITALPPSSEFGPTLAPKDYPSSPYTARVDNLYGLSLDELKEKVSASQKEFDDFAEFLKNKFFSKESIVKGQNQP